MKKALFRNWLPIVYAIVTALSCSIFASASLAQSPNNAQAFETLVITPSDNQFSLSLPSNPTTGYSWALINYDTHQVQVVRHFFVAPKQNMPGAGGKEIWVFKLQPGNISSPLEFKFRYARPWDLQDNPSYQTINVILHE